VKRSTSTRQSSAERRLRRFRVEQAVEAAELRPQLLAQLGRLQELRRVGQPEQPAEERPRVRVRCAVDDAAALLALNGAAVPPVRLDPPGHLGRDADARRARRLRELPGGPVAVGADVEALRRLEVVRGARGVGDPRADTRQAKGALRLAQVAPADEIPFAGDELQAVRVNGALQLLVAGDGVVREADGLALGDRGLQFGQHGRRRGRLGDDRQRRELGVGDELRTPLGQAEQRETQRLRVREAILENGKTRGQRRKLLAAQLDRRQVVGVGRQAVEFRAAADARLGGDLDAEPGELCAVLVEAALERVLGHGRVALDSAADLVGADRLAPAREQKGDERESPHQLIGVLAEAFLADLLAAHRRRSGLKW